MSQNQVNACLLSTGFLMSMVYTMMVKDKNPIVKDFHQSLIPEQKEIYEDITEMRSGLYLQGLILGMILASAFIYFSSDGGLGSFVQGQACVFTLIVMGTAILYYMLMPKDKFMIDHLINRDQIDKWHRVGQLMQKRYYSGFLLGIIGYLFLGYALGQNNNLSG